MTKKIMQMVTQPAHGAPGEPLRFQAGELFEPGTEFPSDVRVTDVIVDTDDLPAKAPAKAKADDAGDGDDDDSKGRQASTPAGRQEPSSGSGGSAPKQDTGRGSSPAKGR